METIPPALIQGSHMGLFALNSVCTAIAVVVSSLTIWKHLKNYRKPADQRLVVRILALVPLFSVSALAALYSPSSIVAEVLTFFREIYEAFVIYTFYSLLTNLLGGEREIIYSKTGDKPEKFLGISIDISDPHTFWAIKWMIMQYVCVRPLVVLISPLLGDNSTLSWVLLILYNVSITVALNSLMAFWVCLRNELAPFRVILKFLSVKMIVFFSYWQVLALKIISAFGFINKSSLPVWQNTLLCIECVGFAVVHHYAFPATDYEAAFMFGFARLRLRYAVRDVLGIADIVHDFKTTFLFPRYGARDFDSVEAVLDHPESQTRQRRIAAGLRYRNGGKSKYWLPNTALKSIEYQSYGSTNNLGSRANDPEDSPEGSGDNEVESLNTVTGDEAALNMEDEFSDGEETLYNRAKSSFGDYNYPVVVVQESEDYVSFEERLRRRHVMGV